MIEKKSPKKEAGAANENAKDALNELEALQAEIQELKAKVLAGEEGALARVTKALGVTPETVKAVEAVESEPEVRMFVQTPVRVNMHVYHGHVQVKLSTARVIQQAIGDRRTRLINELTHNKYQLQELMSGGYASRLVSRETKLEGTI